MQHIYEWVLDKYQWVLDNQWAFDGILGGAILLVLGGIGKILLNRRHNRAASPAPTPSPEPCFIDASGGGVNDSELNNIRTRGAKYFIKGNVSKSKISDVDFQ